MDVAITAGQAHFGSQIILLHQHHRHHPRCRFPWHHSLAPAPALHPTYTTPHISSPDSHHKFSSSLLQQPGELLPVSGVDHPVVHVLTPESDSLRKRSSAAMIHRPQPSHGHDNNPGVVHVAAGMPISPPLPTAATVGRHFMARNDPFMGACQECCMMCVKEHGISREIWNGTSWRPPCFYKLVSDYCVEGGPSCWLQLPVAFVHKYMPHVDRKEMVLQNVNGQLWPVVYTKEHGFLTGWADFSTANNLAIGDTLFFSSVNEARFIVQVFSFETGCEKRLSTEAGQTNSFRQFNKPTPVASTQTRGANRAPLPTSIFPPGRVTRSPRPNADNSGGHNRGGWDGFRTPAAPGHGGTHAGAYDVITPEALPTPEWQGNFVNLKGRPSTSESYKAPSQSVPAPSRRDIPGPSWRGGTGLSSCPNIFGQGLQAGDLRGTEKIKPWRDETFLKTFHARALVTKAILRKMNITPLRRTWKYRGIFRSNQNSLKKKSFIESLESDGEIGFDASSGYNGGRGHFVRERRSFSKDAGFVSSLDSPGWPEEAPSAKFRAFANCAVNTANHGRFESGPSHQHEMADSLDGVPGFRSPKFVSEYTPQYVHRKRGRPRKNPLPTTPQQKPGDGNQASVVGEKRKRGRPFKQETLDMLDNSRPIREIFVSRRRKVTPKEKDDALNAAYTYASSLRASTTFVVVMRQSFVYRNFVLGVPRRFAQRYMPNSNRAVTLIDDASMGWFCSWNAAYKYISGRGWRSFAIDHCIEEDDALLMEILAIKDQSMTIKVHIFRVVAIPDGLTGWESHVCPTNSATCQRNTGVPIAPIHHAPTKIQPRLAPPHRRVKREPVYIEDSIGDSISASDSSEELD